MIVSGSDTKHCASHTYLLRMDTLSEWTEGTYVGSHGFQAEASYRLAQLDMRVLHVQNIKHQSGARRDRSCCGAETISRSQELPQYKPTLSRRTATSGET
jgi:hypothetical protein